MTVATEQAEGLTLTGEYRRAWQEEDRTAADGKTYPGRFKVRVLANDRTVDVEFKNEGTALSILGGEEPQRGELVSIPVGVRAAKGYVFFYGRGHRED